MNMNTPWGRSQHIQRYDDGVAMVSTAGHGGLAVRREYGDKHLSQEARDEAIPQYGHYFFEEDCDWAIAALELPHIWDQLFQYSEKLTTEEARKAYLQDTIKYWNISYAVAKGFAVEGERFYCGQRDCTLESKLEVKVDPEGVKQFVCSSCQRIILAERVK